MMSRGFILMMLLLTFFIACEDNSMMPMEIEPAEMDSIQEFYFPPADHATWDIINPDSLNWNMNKLDDLISYLDEKNTKGFIILKKGKIVVEEYFDDHTINKNWNWYSAAKSLTSTLVGIATMDQLIDIEAKSSTYLGNNWSSFDNEKQDLIKVRNHITMTTGLKNPIDDFAKWICTASLCMEYEADAGSRWAYHQGAFTLTQDILTNATGMNFKQFCKQNLQNRIGMNGSWSEILDLRIFSSTTRSMARFGLLALNKGVWDKEIIYPAEYHEEMVNSSQEINKAYGYLWWLNGKADFLGTQDQNVFNGPLIPNAPIDMFAALGAQDQKIYVIPSLDMVIVRCGESAGNMEFANSSFDNELWAKINEILP